MANDDELLKQFYAVFGNKGGDVYPGNVGISRTAQAVCHEMMNLPDPVLYDHFLAWDNRSENERRPLGVEFWLVQNGQWEAAWALAQLHYYQFLKQENRTKNRLHKGHPLCNLALVARAIGSPALTRHFAMLSSAGDVYWEHQNPDLRDGGLAPTMLEQFESHHQQRTFREKIRNDLKPIPIGKPWYLETFLACRWFSDTYAQHFVSLAEVEKQGGKPFVEVLLDAIENPGDASFTTTGARFEAAAGLLLSTTPGFEVDSARQTSDEQVDLVVVYTPERWTQLGLEPGCGLVECKSSSGKVDVADLRDFGAKCVFHRVRFGILVARAGITGGKVNPDDLFKEPQSAELSRRRFQLDGLTILVLDISQLRGRSRELRGLLDELRTDYRQRLVIEITEEHALELVRVVGNGGLSKLGVLSASLLPLISQVNTADPKHQESTEKEYQVVLLIHGIRTQADWGPMVRSKLEVPGQIEVIPIRYGYFDAFRFWFPFWTRRKPIERVYEQIRVALQKYRRSHPDAKLSIIAHSFGTYIIGEILKRGFDLQIDRLLLCGSVLPQGFLWHQYQGRFADDKVVNECGKADIWPVLAQSASWGYGASGTHGFGAVLVKDRFHAGGHGQYFDSGFVEKYWEPFIRRGEYRGTAFETKMPPTPWWLSVLGILPLQWMIVALIVLALALATWLIHG